jgi:hypothetical protein
MKIKNQKLLIDVKLTNKWNRGYKSKIGGYIL